MADHVIKAVTRNRGQCKCLWCGQYPTPGPCGVDDEMRAEIADWARTHGSRWRMAMAELWSAGLDDGPLRRVRNVLGPRGIYKLDTSRVLRYKPIAS